MQAAEVPQPRLPANARKPGVGPLPSQPAGRPATRTPLVKMSSRPCFCSSSALLYSSPLGSTQHGGARGAGPGVTEPAAKGSSQGCHSAHGA